MTPHIPAIDIPELPLAFLAHVPLLSRFFDPSVMRTIQNAELLADGQEVLKLPELFDVLSETIWTELKRTSHFAARRAAIDQLNRSTRHCKRGLAITDLWRR